MKWFALIMSLIYAVVGALLLLDETFFVQITRFRAPLGILLVVYGVVRGFMWQRKVAESRKKSG